MRKDILKLVNDLFLLLTGLREAMLGLDTAAYHHSYITQNNLGQTASQKSLLDSPQTFVWHSVLVSQYVKKCEIRKVLSINL